MLNVLNLIVRGADYSTHFYLIQILLYLIGLVLLLSVDWFIGIIRACTNLIGNCVAAVVIAHWEKDIDHAQAKAVLNTKP